MKWPTIRMMIVSHLTDIPKVANYRDNEGANYADMEGGRLYGY